MTNKVLLFITLILIISRCDFRNNSFQNKKPSVSELVELKTKIVDKLSLREYQLTEKELCYLAPTLDSLYAKDLVSITVKKPFTIHRMYFSYLSLSITSIEFENRFFVFSTLIEKNLVDKSNEMFKKEVIPELEGISSYSDLQEFKQLVESIKKSNKIDLSSKTRLVDLLNMSFKIYDFKTGFTNMFSDQ